MASIAWQPSMSVGCRELDIQHRHFLGLINNLSSANEHHYPAAMIESLLDALVRYGLAHFESEEQLMLIHHVPDRDEHLAEHHDLRERLQQAVTAYRAGTGSLDALVAMLVAWFQQHTQQSDRRLAGHLNTVASRAEV